MVSQGRCRVARRVLGPCQVMARSRIFRGGRHGTLEEIEGPVRLTTPECAEAKHGQRFGMLGVPVEQPCESRLRFGKAPLPQQRLCFGFAQCASLFNIPRIRARRL